MNTMIFGDLDNPYCRSFDGGFFDWKDTEAEQELSSILIKCQNGILPQFSEEWGDDVLPRLTGTRIINENNNESSNNNQKRGKLKEKIDRFDSFPLEIVSGNAFFGGIEEEIIMEDGIYEEIIFIDYPQPEEQNFIESDVVTLDSCIQKHFKTGFLPIEPNQSVKMELICTLVDRIWETIYPIISELLPNQLHAFTGTSIRSKTPESHTMRIESPHGSDYSLNSSFNEDDFSTTTSISDLHRAILQNDIHDSHETFFLGPIQKAFVQLKPEGDGHDQSIGFGLNHAIRIRPYTTTNETRRNDSKSLTKKKQSNKQKPISSRLQESAFSQTMLPPTTLTSFSLGTVSIDFSGIQTGKKGKKQKKLYQNVINTKKIPSRIRKKQAIPKQKSVFSNTSGLTSGNQINLKDGVIGESIETATPTQKPEKTRFVSVDMSSINNITPLSPHSLTNTSNSMNSGSGNIGHLMNQPSSTSITSTQNLSQNTTNSSNTSNTNPTVSNTVIELQFPQVSHSKNNLNYRPTSVHGRSNDNAFLARGARNQLQSSQGSRQQIVASRNNLQSPNSSRLLPSSTVARQQLQSSHGSRQQQTQMNLNVSRQQLQTAGGFRISRSSTRTIARENNTTITEQNTISILPQISKFAGTVEAFTKNSL